MAMDAIQKGPAKSEVLILSTIEKGLHDEALCWAINLLML